MTLTWIRADRLRPPNEAFQPPQSSSGVIEFDGHGFVFLAIRALHKILYFLPAPRLFDCLDNNSFRFFAGEICNGQVRDGFTPADLRFGIDGNLGNLYGHARRASINNRNLCVFFLGQDITSQIVKDGNGMDWRGLSKQYFVDMRLLCFVWYQYVENMATKRTQQCRHMMISCYPHCG